MGQTFPKTRIHSSRPAFVIEREHDFQSPEKSTSSFDSIQDGDCPGI